MELWDYERQAWNSGAQTLCGVDEAGAGPLAGPVYAAAVILPRELDIPGLNDSKKLTEKKREALFDSHHRPGGGLQRGPCGTAEEIDEMDILNARMLAMQRAIDGLAVRAGSVPSSTATGTTAAACAIDRAPSAASWAGTGRAPPSRRRPFWPRSAGTGTCRRSWTRSIPSTSSPSTRATVRSSTTSCWTSTAPARSTGAPS